MGRSVIVTDSGKDLQFMACEGSELGREVGRQQNSFMYVLAKRILQIVYAGQCVFGVYFLLWVAVCWLCEMERRVLAVPLGSSRAACAAFEVRELPKVEQA